LKNNLKQPRSIVLHNARGCFRAKTKDNGLRHDEVLFVGDNLVDDVLGPQQVNMKTCWLNRNRKPRTAITPDYEIQSLAELIQIFEEA